MDSKRILTAGVTLLIAAAAGHFMQNGFALAGRNAPQAAAKVSEVAETRPSVGLALVPNLPDDLAPPALLEIPKIPSVSVASLSLSGEMASQFDFPTPTPFDLVCGLKFTATPAPAAMVDLTINAPCDANARVVVSYSGMNVVETTNSEGNLSLSVPALADTSVVTISFDSGANASVVATVSDLDQYARSAVSWSGPGNISIHAMEFGAEFGGNGHVWAGSMRGPYYATDARGGFLVRLGDPEAFQRQMAEIYTFPVAATRRDGSVELIIEAEVTEFSCGQDVAGRVVELLPETSTREVDIALAMPDCDAAGGYLVLNNLLHDLKIARK